MNKQEVKKEAVVESKKPLLNLYVTERTTKDGKKKFKAYKSRNKQGEWIEVRFTQEAGVPKAYFEMGKKGYAVIEIVDGNTTTKQGVKDKDGNPIYVMWIAEWKDGTKAENETFKAHIEKVQKEFAETQEERFNSFVNN